MKIHDAVREPSSGRRVCFRRVFVVMVSAVIWAASCHAADSVPVGKLDSDGDGLTDEDEIHYGKDPHDYYNGELPELKILGGDGETGEVDQVLRRPLSVQVGHAFTDAPVEFAVESALLSVDGINDWRHKLTVKTAPQFGVTAARVFVKLIEAEKPRKRVVISVTTGGKTKSIEATVGVTSEEVPSPKDFKVMAISLTSARLQWTPAVPDRAVSVEISHDNRATWKLWGVMPPGVRNVKVEGLDPDALVSFRLTTGDLSQVAGEKAGETKN